LKFGFEHVFLESAIMPTFNCEFNQNEVDLITKFIKTKIMNKKVLITTITALILGVAGGSFYMSQNSEMFSAQTAYKSYNYEDSLKAVEDFINQMPLTANESGNKTFEAEIDKLVANKTIKKQEDLFKVRAALFTGPENGIKVHIYNVKFKPTSYNCICLLGK
jgi:hypothetical protein